MTDTELIARQAKQIAEQANLIDEYRNRIKRARQHIYCIGGPLNDNVLRYNREQMLTFHRIAEELGDIE